MILTLAMRNFSHDRLRSAVTVIGIMLAVVLLAVQLGLYLSASRMITSAVDKAEAELWVMPYGTPSFDEGVPLLSHLERHQVLATPGVASVVPLVVGFADWRRPDGAIASIVVLGSDAEQVATLPWDIAYGSAETLREPDAVGVDRTYFADLGIDGVGSIGHVEEQRARVKVVTDGIRSFTQSPYIFTTAQRARNMFGVGRGAATFLLVRTAHDADPETVRRDIGSRLNAAEVLTTSEFRARNLQQWLFNTGAGIALIGGAVLGLIVGTVIVSQTLYSSTKDHLREYATLRALGSSSDYLYKVVMVQAALCAVIGYGVGLVLSLVLARLSLQTPMPILLTPGLATALLVLTVAMAAVAAAGAIYKIMQIDPASVFAR